VALNEREIADALAERQEASRVLDRWGGLRTYYRDFQDDLSTVQSIVEGDWAMIWPDGTTERVDPAVPNLVEIALEDRARGVSATPPMYRCRAEGEGDEAREKANKVERIVTSMSDMNHLTGYTTSRWAQDYMAGGLVVAQVHPETDLTLPKNRRFPKIRRLEPSFSYPDPVFTPGPFVDSFMYAYEEYRRNVEDRYGVTLDWPRLSNPKEVSTQKVRVVEYHDKTVSQVMVQELAKDRNGVQRYEMLVSAKHGLSKCPIVVTARPRLTGVYRGEFNNGLGVLQYWDRLMRMVMDDAIRKVYPERVVYNIQNPEDYGPDSTIVKETPDGTYEYVAQPNQPFSNFQIMREVSGSVRTSFLLPVSRSGDPNESIISAAGIGATQGQFNEDVRHIQRDALGPLQEAAFEIALEADEKWYGDVEKTIWSSSPGAYKETYKPKVDINGYRKVQVRYGAMSGLDEVNQGVMVMQQLGSNIISKADAQELSPFVEDPQRTQKRQLQEQVQQAMLASVLQAAATGQISPFILSMISQAVESDEVTLSEAISALVPQQLPPAATGGAPAAPPTAPGATQPQAPGIAGAAEGPLPQNTAVG